jgi:hypothetical protein
MKSNGMKGMSLLVVLGFVMSILIAFAPAGAANARAGNFDLNVTFTDEQGGHTNSSMAMTQVNITANISVAASMENVTELKVMMDINSGEESSSMILGALNSGEFKEFTFQWTPTMYGDYSIEITAINGTDTANQTTTTLYYKALASDIIIQTVTISAQKALIGVDEVTVTAALVNNGNAPGTANVTFGVGSEILGNVLQDVVAGGNANAVLATKFDGVLLADGEYQVGAVMLDWTSSQVFAAQNITLTTPASKLAVDSLIVSAASALEGTNVTFTALLNNSGTAPAVNQTLIFADGATMLGAVTNLTVGMGQTQNVQFVWTLPDVAANTVKNITAAVGDSSAWVNITIVAKVPVILITDFTVPDGMRIGDVKGFSATIKNNGTGDATDLVVDFYDNATKLASSAPFNLTVGSSFVATVNVTMVGTADVSHTFFVKAMGVEKNATKTVTHLPVPASVGITSITVKPAKKDKQPQDSTQSYTLTVTLKNTGEVKSSNCTLTIKEGTKTLFTENIALDGNQTLPKTYTWKVKGSGGHTATATLTGADAGTPASQTAKCTLEYTPGFEVLFLVAAIVVAVILVRRRKN